MTKKVAVVTGSNRGIGFAIVRGLCKQFQGDVFLTSRNVELGKAAVEELNKEGLSPKYHQLDITDPASVQALGKFLQDNYGGLDILVNNAGIAVSGSFVGQSEAAPFGEQAEMNTKCNFWGTLNVCNELFPLLRPHARVVNVSSGTSTESVKKLSPEQKKRVLSAETISDCEKFITEFVEDAKAGIHLEKGWSDNSYGMSKVGMTAMSLIQYQDLAKDTSRPDIIVNVCCPGFTDTDFGGFRSGKGKPIDEGADTPLYLALLPPNTQEPAGKFLSDRKERPWKDL